MALSIRSMLITALLVVVISGCSGHDAPSAPNITGETGTGQELTDTVRDGAVFQGNHYCMLYNVINIDMSDPDDVKMEVIPVRLGEIHLNILKLLEVGPCTDCFKLVGFNLIEPGVLDVDIEITHPFDNLDYSVFDVRGIMMFNGSHLFPASGMSISDPALGDGALMNADGYTALYNGSTFGQADDLMTYFPGKFSTPTIPDAYLNGYIRHNTEITRNAFFAGDSVTQTYRLKMPTTQFVLGYAVDANWWTPIETPVDDPLTDFDLDANCPEPWKLNNDITDIGDGLTTDGGEAKLSIFVFDWQGKESHAAPVIECPELFDGTKEMVFKADGDGYTQYDITLTNELLADVGEYLCLAKVEDNDNAGAPDWLDLSAYRTVTLTVVEQMHPPIAMADFVPDPPVLGEDVTFSDDGSYDPDGGILTKFEWDWENDGIFDEEGAEVTHSWDVASVYYVQYRVTDDEGETNTLDEPLEISFGFVPPVAIAEFEALEFAICEPVYFYGSESYDPDGGEIVKYEWDWENDGTFDDEGANLQHIWYIPDTYDVQLRVTDDEGQTDILDEPLQVSRVQCEPVAIASADKLEVGKWEPITFTGEDSHDNDCDGESIVKWEWDWENDGTFDETGMVKSHSYNAYGYHDVMLRVTDNEGSSDTLSTALQINVIEDTWVNTWGGGSNDYVYDATTDGLTNIYSCGVFSGTGVDFDPGEGELLKDSNGDVDSYLCKYNSQGELLWVGTWGSSGYDPANSIDCAWEAGGKFIYVTGSFTGTVDFDPGSSVYNRTTVGDTDAFLSKFDLDGNHIWTTSWGGNMWTHGVNVTRVVDPEGVAVCGDFYGTTEFDPGDGWWERTSHGGCDFYLSWFDTDGNFEYGWAWGGTHDDYAYGLDCDYEGCVYMTGTFRKYVDFFPGSSGHKYTSNGEGDIFILKRKKVGDPWLWNHGMAVIGGTGDDVGYDLCIQSLDVYVTGYFGDSVDFDASAGGNDIKIANGKQDAFLTRYSLTLDYDWSQTWGSSVYSADDVGLGLGFTYGGIHVTGTFENNASGSPVDFDPGAGVHYLTSNGMRDIFISKFYTGGGFAWASSIGCSFHDYGYSITTLDTPIVCGSFQGKPDFDPDPFEEYYKESNGNYDAFMVKLDNDGGL